MIRCPGCGESSPCSPNDGRADDLPHTAADLLARIDSTLRELQAGDHRRESHLYRMRLYLLIIAIPAGISLGSMAVYLVALLLGLI